MLSHSWHQSHLNARCRCNCFFHLQVYSLLHQFGLLSYRSHVRIGKDRTRGGHSTTSLQSAGMDFLPFCHRLCPLWYLGRTTLFFAFFFLAIILFGFLTYSVTKISETKPVTVAEVSAWMLQSSSFFGDPALFRTAIEIAGDSHNVRALLLERFLLLVEPLIFITLGDKVQSITPQQEAFLKCLQDLIDGIDPSEGNFWHNMAPIPSKALSRELRKWQNLSCPLMEDDSGKLL